MQSEFWNKVAKSYAEKPVSDVKSYEETLRRTLEYLRPTDEVLELGGGRGSTALTLAPKVSHIVCSDFSSEMIEIARSKLNADGVNNVTFEVATAQTFAKGEKRFDAILAFNLLHLIADLEKELADIYSLLNPGGYFISKSGALGRKALFLKPIIALMRLLGKAPFVNFLTKEQYRAAHLAAGFEVEIMEFIPKDSTNVFIVARRPS